MRLATCGSARALKAAAAGPLRPLPKTRILLDRLHLLNKQSSLHSLKCRELVYLLRWARRSFSTSLVRPLL
jgi:hypothetical protein